jgi:UDP-glucose 4-epimerase
MPTSKLKSILIIGGHGFIGSHFASFYESQGHLVHRTTRYFQKESSSSSYSIDYSKSSFLEIISSNNYDLIFSLSGNPYPAFSENNPLYDIEHTVIPSLNLLDALSESNFKGNLWYGSSVAVYGETSLKEQSEDDFCKPLSSYALAKLTVERYMRIYSTNHNLNCGSFRIFSTFGEGLNRQIIYDLYKKCQLQVETLDLFGTGQEARDISYVGDQIMRMSMIADKVIPKGDIFNIGSGESLTTKQIAEEILGILNIKKKITFVDQLRNFDGLQWTASIKKFESITKNPKSQFRDTLKKTLMSYESNEF